jgi:hypothetical protein
MDCIAGNNPTLSRLECIPGESPDNISVSSEVMDNSVKLLVIILIRLLSACTHE